MLSHGQPAVAGRVFLGAQAPHRLLAFKNVTVFIYLIDVFLFQKIRTYSVLFYMGIFNLIIQCEHLFFVLIFLALHHVTSSVVRAIVSLDI